MLSWLSTDESIAPLLRAIAYRDSRNWRARKARGTCSQESDLCLWLGHSVGQQCCHYSIRGKLLWCRCLICACWRHIWGNRGRVCFRHRAHDRNCASSRALNYGRKSNDYDDMVSHGSLCNIRSYSGWNKLQLNVLHSTRLWSREVPRIRYRVLLNRI